MAEKILIVTGDGGESYEVLYALHRFQEAGYTTDIAAPSARSLHLVQHDFEPGWDTYIERHGYRAEANISFDDVAVDHYKAIMLIGGRAPEYLRNNAKLLDIVKEFHSKDKWIYCICHGIQILATAGLAEGRTITCYEHCRAEAEVVGGKWMSDQAVIDGKIICGQTWMSHPEFYRLIFQHS